MWGASGKFHRSVRRENIACLLPVRLSTYVGSIKTNVWFICTHNDPPTWNSACPVRSAFQSNWIVSRQNRFYFIQQANLAASCAHFWTKFSLLWRCCATWQHRFCTQILNIGLYVGEENHNRMDQRKLFRSSASIQKTLIYCIPNIKVVLIHFLTLPVTTCSVE